MLEYLPKDVQEGLAAARRGAARKRSRLRAQVGDEFHPILRFWDRGFALEADVAPAPRGLVDVYDGGRHLLQCLIVASEIEAGELICEYKWIRRVAEKPPSDFARDEQAPVGLLPPTQRA